MPQSLAQSLRRYDGNTVGRISFSTMPSGPPAVPAIQRCELTRSPSRSGEIRHSGVSSTPLYTCAGR